jgi:hypothetical protein
VLNYKDSIEAMCPECEGEGFYEVEVDMRKVRCAAPEVNKEDSDAQ